MLVRNVGHLMTNPAILDRDGNEVPEGIMDAVVTGLIALHDIGAERPARKLAPGLDLYRQAEDARAGRSGLRRRALRAASKQLLGLAPNTIKIGIMDEERRTTVNLKECIRAAQGPASSSSTPASSTAPATRSTPRWKPAR